MIPTELRYYGQFTGSGGCGTTSFSRVTYIEPYWRLFEKKPWKEVELGSIRVRAARGLQVAARAVTTPVVEGLGKEEEVQVGRVWRRIHFSSRSILVSNTLSPFSLPCPLKCGP